jgi:PAS domain-containing protein
MFPDRRERTFAYAFPEAWAQIQKHETGQFWTAAGLFTFTTVRPLDPTQVSSTGSFRAFAPSTTRVGADTYRWIVVSRVSPVVLSARLAGRVHGLPSLALGMLGILAAGTALLAGMGEKRRRAEAALRESEAFQRTLLEQLPVGVAVVDAASGVVERVNRATAALVGEPVERLLGRAWGAWLKGGAARRAGGPPGPSLGGAGEGLLVRADGTEIPVLTAVACLPERGRETLLASIVDLTAQRQAEAARAEVERLQGAMEAAGAAAHALNQPLQVLSGHLQLLELRSEETVSRESLRSMMAQIERMGQTTTALASITRYATMPYVGTQQILDIERAAAAESRRLDVLEWMTDGCDGRAQTTAEELHV